MFATKKQRIEKQEPKINIVLDIDGVLSTPYHPFYHDTYGLKTGSRWESFFKAKKLYIQIEFDGKDQDDHGPVQHWDLRHFVNPAVPAFIKALFAIQNSSISFYSSGDKRRNVPFIEQLLCRSLGDLTWESLKSTVKIFSKSDLICSRLLEDKHKERFETYEYNKYFHGNYKKDLLTVVNSEQELEWTVIIDDDHSYVVPDQAKNLIKVKELRESYYMQSLESINRDEKIGEDFYAANNIFCAMGILLTALEKMKGKSISLKEALFLVQYTDTVKGLDLDKEEKSLKSCYYKSQEKKDYYDIGLKHLQQYQPDLGFFTRQALLDHELTSNNEISNEASDIILKI